MARTPSGAPATERTTALSFRPFHAPTSVTIFLGLQIGALPVRFVGVGTYSLNIEVAAYISTSDYDEFLALQQELLLKMLQAVEQAGTALAIPRQETFEFQRAAKQGV